MKFNKYSVLLTIVVMIMCCITGCNSTLPKSSEPTSTAIETLLPTSTAIETLLPTSTEIVRQPYSSYVSDIANCNVHIDMLSWMGQSQIKEGMQDKSCEFNGVTYTGKYLGSEYRKFHSYLQDDYYCDNFYSFSLHSQTGQLVSMTFTNKDFFDTEGLLEDVENPYENALVRSKEIASMYVDNLDDYECTVTVENYENEKDGKLHKFDYYKVTYMKMCGSFETADYVRVTVSSKGSVLFFMVGDIGAFDDLNDEEFEEKVNSSVEQKINDSFKDVSSDFTTKTEYSIIVLSPEGEYFVYSYVYIYPEDITEDGIQTMSAVIMTFIGDK